jgi:serine/threonine-protein kinase
VDVLARNLDGAGPLRTVSPSVALSRWRGRSDRRTAAELGRRTGAGLALVGSVLRSGRDSVRVTAAIVESASGRVVCEVERRGPILHMDLVTDSLTLALLREFERRRGTGVTPPTSLGREVSLDALKAYLRGEQFYRRARWDSARVYYEHAVAHDSTFALALRRLGQVRGWQHVTVDPVALRYLLRAGALNRGLTPRDSLLLAADSILAAANLETADLATWTHSRRLFATLEEAVRRHPDAPGAWLALGEAGYHFGFGPVLGRGERQVLAAFDRAIDLDSGFAGAYIHPVELGFNLGGRDLGLRYARRYLALEPQEPQHRGVRLVLLLTDTVRAGATEVEQLLDTVSADALVSARTILRRWPDSAETAVRLSRLLALGRRSTYPLFSDTAFMRRRLAQQLAFRGHLREAGQVLGHEEAPIFAELAFLGAVQPAVAATAFARWTARESEYARLALPWWSTRGDTAAIETFRAQAARRRDAEPDEYAVARTWYDTTSARAHLLLARGDTAGSLAWFRALPDSLCSGCYMDRLVRALLLARAGAHREALAALDEPLNAYLTPLEVVFALERGRVAERLGSRREAARAFRFVAHTWLWADPELRSSTAEAREAYGRATGEHPRPESEIPGGVP